MHCLGSNINTPITTVVHISQATLYTTNVHKCLNSLMQTH